MTHALHVMFGLAGAGKSTLAARLGADLGIAVVTVDAIRTDRARARSVFEHAYATTERALRACHSVVFDSCALHAFQRRRLLQIARATHARAELWILDTPWRACRARDAARVHPSGIQWFDVLPIRNRAHTEIQAEPWHHVHRVIPSDDTPRPNSQGDE